MTIEGESEAGRGMGSIMSPLHYHFIPQLLPSQYHFVVYIARLQYHFKCISISIICLYVTVLIPF